MAPQAAALATHLLPSTTQERFLLALWLKTSAEIKHHHPWCVPELKEARGEIVRRSRTEHRSAICGKHARLMARKSFPKTTETNFYFYFLYYLIVFIFQTFYKTLICCLDRMQEAQYCIHVYPQYEARTSWFSLAWSGTGGGRVSPKRMVYVHLTTARSLVHS